jgi:hypothetical protein
MSQFLVVGDVDRIQDYVFGSSRLRAIRGASALLDHVAKQVRDSLSGQADVKLLRWRGGQIVALLKDDAQLQPGQVCAFIEKTFRDRSEGEATITTAYEPYRGSPDFKGKEPNRGVVHPPREWDFRSIEAGHGNAGQV